MLPYLHERKIHLNRLKFNTKYFYTSIQTHDQDIEQYQKQINRQFEQENMSFLESEQSQVLENSKITKTKFLQSKLNRITDVANEV